MVDVVRKTLPELPEYIHVIGPEEKINTYDLIDIADVGLVYTTTVGLEMALKGIPVIVAGQTHYRGRGFTIDPNSWVDYFKMLGSLLEDPKKHRLSKEEIDTGWKYAYHFFYTFPLSFPCISSSGKIMRSTKSIRSLMPAARKNMRTLSAILPANPSTGPK
jgi:capsule polysaccharide export protein KpsC/LpsZ